MHLENTSVVSTCQKDMLYRYHVDIYKVRNNAACDNSQTFGANLVRPTKVSHDQTSLTSLRFLQLHFEFSTHVISWTPLLALPYAMLPYPTQELTRYLNVSLRIHSRTDFNCRSLPILSSQSFSTCGFHERCWSKIIPRLTTWSCGLIKFPPIYNSICRSLIFKSCFKLLKKVVIRNWYLSILGFSLLVINHVFISVSSDFIWHDDICSSETLHWAFVHGCWSSA